MQAHEVGDHPTEQGASSVTEVPPHSVDTHRAAPLGGAGDIADHSQQGGIDQGGACPEDDRADSPIRETPKGDDHQSHALADELGRWARLQVMGAGTGDGKVVSPLPGGGGGPQGAGGNGEPANRCGDGHKSGSDSSDAGGVEKLLDEDKDTHHQDKDTEALA